jgi:hypothetical protein
MADSPTRYPLTWPDATPRTPSGARESCSKFQVTFGRAVESVLEQLRLLGAVEHTIIISSNVAVRYDGLPRAGAEQNVADPGVAVYWEDRAVELNRARDDARAYYGGAG